MKKTLRYGAALLVLFLLAVWGVGCPPRSVFRVTVMVTDDAGVPVEGATVSTHVYKSFTMRLGEGGGREFFSTPKRTTNAAGAAVFTGTTSRYDMVFRAEKEGHYRGVTGVKRGVTGLGVWQPWNPTLPVTLKRVIHPIPLMAKSVRTGGAMPVLMPADEAGYDLEAGDWAAPHGKGRHGDLVFRVEGRRREEGTPYDTRLTISFSHPGDGLAAWDAPRDRGSVMHMPYEAPMEGYLPGVSWRKTGGDHWGTEKLPPGIITPISDDTPAEQNYFLRVRTVLDSRGAVVSAHYAKVQRGFSWSPKGHVQFRYYFNPTANDRNLEFDPARNLLKTKSGELVTDP